MGTLAAMPREIIVDWVTPAGSGFASVMYFDLGTAAAANRSSLNSFLGSVDALLDSNTIWTIRTDGRELDNASGTLTASWTEGTVYTGAGATAGQCVPDTAQVLFRWGTGVVVGGRFLKGRTYIPGLSTANVTEGNVAAAAQTTFNTAATAFVTSGFGVWHRPVAGAGGSFSDATTGSVWSEFASLRQRRG
jgi:hypothetical protein